MEQHWNGDILDTKETVLKFIQSLKWKGKNPFVNVTNKIYTTGIKVKKEIMEIYESMLERSAHIGKWSITINLEKCKEVLDIELKV